jgi:hypothetical protein
MSQHVNTTHTGAVPDDAPPGTGSLYSPSCREGVFPETPELQVLEILENKSAPEMGSTY